MTYILTLWLIWSNEKCYKQIALENCITSTNKQQSNLQLGKMEKNEEPVYCGHLFLIMYLV